VRFYAQGRIALLYAERNYESRKKYMEALALVPEERRVYVDETGFDAPLMREYGYARRGKKLHGERTGKRYERTSLIAGLKRGKSLAPMEFKGGSTLTGRYHRCADVGKRNAHSGVKAGRCGDLGQCYLSQKP
jgi:hypothetical protein